MPFDRARISPLADATLPLEWAGDGVFEDRSTLAVLNPALEPTLQELPDGRVEVQGEQIRILHREDGECFSLRKAPALSRSKLERGFTLVEVLAVIAVIAILAALLFPVASRLMESAGAVRCASNLRQISTYFNQFAADNNGCLPISSDVITKVKWYQQLTPYSKVEASYAIQPDVKVFVCPQSNFPQRLDGFAMGMSYGYNQNLMQKQWRVVGMTRPLSRIILLAERWASNSPDPNGRKGGGDANWAVNLPYDVAPNTGGNACLRVKHGKSSNYLFLDGHIERLEPTQTYPDGKGTETDLWIVK